jgi:hypothetical protein
MKVHPAFLQGAISFSYKQPVCRRGRANGVCADLSRLVRELPAAQLQPAKAASGARRRVD